MYGPKDQTSPPKTGWWTHWVLALRVPHRLYLLLGLFALDLLALTLFRVGFYFGFSPASPMPGRELGLAFVYGLRFDIKTLAFLYLPLIALVFLPYTVSLPKRKWQIYLCSLAYFLLSLLLVVVYVFDAGYYAYLHTRVSVVAMQLVGDPVVAWDFLLHSYPVVWISVGMVLTAGLLTFLKYRWQFFHVDSIYQCKIRPSPPLPLKKRVLRTLVPLIYFIAATGLWVLGAHGSTTPVGLNWTALAPLRSNFSQELGYNPFIKLFESANKTTPSISIEDIKNVSTWLAQNNPAALHKSAWAPAAAPVVPPGDLRLPKNLNVVLVIMESYVAERTGIFGNALHATPQFDRIAREGMLFTRFFSSGNVTMRGIFSSLASIPDVTKNWVTDTPGLARQSSPLNVFTRHQKQYFIGGDVAWAGLGGFLYATIPEIKVFERSAFPEPRVNSWGISDRNLFLNADRILSQQKQPFFAIIQTAHNHRPFGLAPEDVAQLAPVPFSLAQLRANGFQNELEFRAWQNHDYALGVWLQDVKKQAWFDDTLFVFIGDHGVGNDIPTQVNNPIIKNNLQQFHTPLLLWAPKWLPAKVIETIGGQPDILPTLAALLGYAEVNDSKAPAFLGRDLLSEPAQGGRAFILLDADAQKLGLVTPQFYAQALRNDIEGSLQMTPIEWGNAPPAPLNEADRIEARRALRAIDTAALWLIQENPKSPPHH